LAVGESVAAPRTSVITRSSLPSANASRPGGVSKREARERPSARFVEPGVDDLLVEGHDPSWTPASLPAWQAPSLDAAVA
jgi:hypothetical protein